MRGLLDARGLDYGMFGHVDAGVLHVRLAIDMKDQAQEAMIREVTAAVVGLTRKYGGLLWGEHGKGVRSEHSPAFFGPLYPLVQAVKAAFDPRNQLNPGKIATPDGSALLTVNGVPTRGQADRSIPAGARIAFDESIHCNGNGACYDWDPEAAMCPSWKAMRGRRHAPKGRAMLLQGWLAGQTMERPRAEPAQYRLLSHCTERTTATASLRDWQSVFSRPGPQLEILAGGCCGMAGNYGHEAEHRDTSERIYDLSWRRHVAAGEQGGRLLATGYSCRSQAKRLDRVALPHPAPALLQAPHRPGTAAA